MLPFAAPFKFEKKRLTNSVFRAYGQTVRHVTIEKLPQGIAGTRRTLDRMAAAVRGEIRPDFRGYLHETIRVTALDLVAGVPPRDWRGEIGRLFEFVRDRITYRLDPVDAERVQDPVATLEIGSGDCDDLVVLLAALLGSLGYWSRFVAQTPDGVQFDHVYLEVETPRGWLALDPTADGHGVIRAAPGWRNPTGQEWIYQIW
jgi:transglutaminase-like putative cysteine protease